MVGTQGVPLRRDLLSGLIRGSGFITLTLQLPIIEGTRAPIGPYIIVGTWRG